MKSTIITPWMNIQSNIGVYLIMARCQYFSDNFQDEQTYILDFLQNYPIPHIQIILCLALLASYRRFIQHMRRWNIKIIP